MELFAHMLKNKVNLNVRFEVFTMVTMKNAGGYGGVLCLRLQKLASHITELNLSCNALSVLPAELGLCQNLQYLDLQRNLLESLPQAFECLTKLRELVMAFNK
jgi:hypothetical protein